MPDVMQKASAWLEAQRVAYRTIPVRYTRDAKTVLVQATVAASTFEVDDGAGAALRIETRDYLVAAAELVGAGIALPPRQGDVIAEGGDGAGVPGARYEVIAPAAHIPAWRWSDRFRTRLRIHTSLASSEDTYGDA